MKGYLNQKRSKDWNLVSMNGGAYKIDDYDNFLNLYVKEIHKKHKLVMKNAKNANLHSKIWSL